MSDQGRVVSRLSLSILDLCLVSGQIFLGLVEIFLALSKKNSIRSGFRSKITALIWPVNYCGSKIMVGTCLLHWSSRIGPGFFGRVESRDPWSSLAETNHQLDKIRSTLSDWNHPATSSVKESHMPIFILSTNLQPISRTNLKGCACAACG